MRKKIGVVDLIKTSTVRLPGSRRKAIRQRRHTKARARETIYATIAASLVTSPIIVLGKGRVKATAKASKDEGKGKGKDKGKGKGKDKGKEQR